MPVTRVGVLTSTPIASSLARGPPGEALVESLQDARRRVEQDDARSSGVD
jgi:hypothetical protein